MEQRNSTCCFFGHRKVADEEVVKQKLFEIVENLIVIDKVDTFLFGSKSKFDELCRDVVSELKKKYTFIKRVYVRAEFPFINDDYRAYLLENVEDTYYPDNLHNAGRAVYVKRNCEMIDKSEFCVVYFKDDYAPPRRKNSRRDLFDYQPKSGTGIAFEYATHKKRKIVNVADT